MFSRQIVGFYNGVRMSDFQSRMRKADRKSAYRMDNSWSKDKEVGRASSNWAEKDKRELFQILNIPEGLREPHQYRASLGHLINHSPNPNTWFGMIDHPRFGKIRTVAVKADMKAGEELLVDYGYIQQYFEVKTTRYG